MNGRPFLPLALCASVAVGCGPTSSSVGGATSLTDTHPVRSMTRVRSTTSTPLPCTRADLDAPAVKVMPTPEIVRSPLPLDDGNETLSPTDTAPRLNAAQAWGVVVGSGFGPRAGGTVRLLLADLSAKTPAEIQNFVWPPTSDHPDTQSKPVYTHSLVWAVIATDQAEVGSGGPSVRASGSVSTATTVPKPLCLLETAVSYVDADTGALLFAENF